MTTDEAKPRAVRLLQFISDPLATSVYATHPNDLTALQLKSDENTYLLPPEWNEWWQWCGNRADSWSALVKMSNSIDVYRESGDWGGGRQDTDRWKLVQQGLPENLARLLADARALSLPREPHYTRMKPLEVSPVGMSPKKFYEVSRMVSYVLELLDTLRERYGSEVRHVVDIGAGQGHLSRSLCANRDVHVLAIDSSRDRAESSPRKFQQSKSRGTLTHRTFWLGEGPSFDTHPGLQGSELQKGPSFDEIMDEWIDTFVVEDKTPVREHTPRQPVPVLFVALHACGSLTISILQEVLNHQRNRTAKGKAWFVAGSVVIGCCYNLMGNADFPKSRVLRNHIEAYLPGFELSPSHLQLAAQLPSEWFRSVDAATATELAVRKILFRALVAPLLPESCGKNTPRKLGKLNVKAYENFETYLKWAGRRMGKDLSASFEETIARDPITIGTSSIARRIRSLHALRCLLGPPVESLIILDRYLWLHEELEDKEGLDANLVNLFDQKEGSGRNIAIVLVPSARFNNGVDSVR